MNDKLETLERGLAEARKDYRDCVAENDWFFQSRSRSKVAVDAEERLLWLCQQYEKKIQDVETVRQSP